MEREVCGYCVAESGDVERLTCKVEELISEGWEPQGGISGFYNLAGYHYQQAMVMMR
jgi:hypothetical protein